jgi:hypothetical protein
MYVKIKYIDGTEQKEYCESFSVTKYGNLLSICKGRNEHIIYINMQTVKSFQEED